MFLQYIVVFLSRDVLNQFQLRGCNVYPPPPQFLYGFSPPLATPLLEGGSEGEWGGLGRPPPPPPVTPVATPLGVEHAAISQNWQTTGDTRPGHRVVHRSRGAGATGAAGATSPIAQTVRGQHGGNRLLFLLELHFEIRTLFTGIGNYNYF